MNKFGVSIWHWAYGRAIQHGCRCGGGGIIAITISARVSERWWQCAWHDRVQCPVFCCIKVGGVMALWWPVTWRRRGEEPTVKRKLGQRTEERTETKARPWRGEGTGRAWSHDTVPRASMSYTQRANHLDGIFILPVQCPILHTISHMNHLHTNGHFRFTILLYSSIYLLFSWINVNLCYFFIFKLFVFLSKESLHLRSYYSPTSPPDLW